MRVEIPYTPRDQFKPFHARQQRWAVLVVHRRAGKTTSLLADMLRKAILGPPDGRYVFIAPLLSQAKTIAWDILKTFSHDLTAKAHESELRIDLVNGARIRLFGADNYDALRGQRLDGCAIDEYSDIAPELFDEVIRPALADRQGWAVFSGTPKGVNHFKTLFDYAIDHSDEFYVLKLKASESNLLLSTELADARRQMTPEVYEQEFECSWVAPKSGSYYGELLNRHSHQVGNYPYDPTLEVEVACDLGYTDSCSWWYWQSTPEGYRIIDFDEGDNKTIDYWMDLLAAKGYRYKKIWLPHDARAKSFQTGKSTIEQLLSRDVPCAIGPELSVQHGIDAVKFQLPNWYFNEQTTLQGLNHLKAYHRKWDAKNKVFSNRPAHDSHSHAADAARYMALVQREYRASTLVSRPTVTSIDKAFALEVLWADKDYELPSERI